MSKRLNERKEEAAMKYHKYAMEERFILASYWQRKWRKLVNMEIKATADIKRQLVLEGVKKLNTVKI